MNLILHKLQFHSLSVNYSIVLTAQVKINKILKNYIQFTVINFFNYICLKKSGHTCIYITENTNLIFQK